MPTKFAIYNIYKEYSMRYLVIVFCMMLLYGCQSGSENKDERIIIDFSDQDSKIPQPNHNDSSQKLVVAFTDANTPKETFIYYEELFGYLSQKLNCEIEFNRYKNDQEIMQLLAHNAIDIALLSSGAYVMGKEKDSFELLVAPQCYNKLYCQSYIIVYNFSAISNFVDLEGKSFAVMDQTTNTSKIFMDHKLRTLGFTRSRFFSSTLNASSCDIAVRLVSKQVVEGACVDGLTYEYMAVHYPEIISRVKVIEKSVNWGTPPLVVSTKMLSGLKQKLKEIFLSLHNDPKGKEILMKLSIDQFFEGNGANYKPIEAFIRFTN